jgi:glycosyltransferase involved in cell wall biosynthesis
MNILLVAKLSDNSLNCILEPLIKLASIERIYVLRDTVGSIKSSKITYFNNQFFSHKNKLRHFIKMKKGIEICKKYEIDFIIGVLIYPHGYIGRLISIYTGIPYIHVTIAGQREFWVMGKYIEKFNLLFFKKSYAITVTGNNTRAYFTANGFNPQKIIVLPNVIKMDKYCDYVKERKYDIISLSRLDKNKNISLLLNVIAKLKNTINVQVLIAGDGSEYNNLKIEAKLLAIENNVHFIGWVEEDEIINIFNNAKIFVLCSKGEGFPLSLLEAMACGCVPIVTDVGDVSDVVLNDLNGYIIKDYSNENQMAAIIESLIKSPDKIKKLSFKAKEVKTKYSFENVEEIWEKIFNINKNDMVFNNH